MEGRKEKRKHDTSEEERKGKVPIRGEATTEKIKEQRKYREETDKD